MKLTYKDVLKEAKNYFFITIGLAIFVLGWSAFMTPYEVTGGGVAGIASILFFATGIPIGFTTFALNAILIAIAWKVLGPKFCINSLICTFIISVFFYIGQRIFTQPIVDDMLTYLIL